MIAIWITGSLAVVLLGFGVFRIFKKRPISLVVLVVTLALGSVFGLGVGAYYTGLHVVQDGAVGGYHQFLNGSLVSADVQVTHCERDGSCYHEDTHCDPYIVLEDDSYTDSDGKVHHRTKPVTHYHSCPQMTEEYSYTVTDNFKNTYVLADHIFATNPVPWRNYGVDMSGSNRVSRGIPQRWQQLKDGIDAGDAAPVTVPDTYDNYVLGSENTILKQHSADIKQLQKSKLLPPHTANLSKSPIHDDFDADKVSFVGMSPPGNAADWQRALMKFNSALGVQRQGDLHVVVLKASSLPSNISQENYLLALKAYWLNGLGKNAIAKNGIILVLALDDSATTIQWAAAGTGMPVGNGEMIQALQLELPGVTFSPDKVFGDTKATVTVVNGKKKPSYTLGSGVVPQIVMVEFPFLRACMGCEGKEDKGQQGFVYLKTEIPLSGGGLVVTIILYLLTVCVVWGVALWGFNFLTMGEYYGADSSRKQGSYPFYTRKSGSLF